MPRGDKPYRVYRGGRAKGDVPLEAPRRPRTPRQAAAKPSSEGVRRYAGPGPKTARKRPRWGRWVAVTLIALAVLFLAWGIASYVALAHADHAAQKRLGPEATAVLTKQDGLLMSSTTDVLVLGTDHSNAVGREANRHSDSMMLLRIGGGRTAYLSIPRDLRVSIPGHGPDKINAAMQLGGPALAIRTVRDFTDLPINHVVVVDFGGFRDLIDRVGGVDVTVPAAIVSNKFDCPYTAQRCTTWRGYRFAKGRQHMDGRRALVYSRIRENRLNAADTDITRGSRQQAVLGALKGKLLGIGTLGRLPFLGGDLLKPVATDMSAGDLMQLVWLTKVRGGSTLHCRLGGSSNGSMIIPDNEAKRHVLRQLAGAEPPLPPAVDAGLYAPGCSTKELS